MSRTCTPLRTAFRRPWPTTRRGLKLWFFSSIIGLKGVGYINGKSSGQNEAALELATRCAPIEMWGALIIALCVFAAVCAYCHHGRDRYGYATLVGFSFAWGAVYAVTPLFLDGPTWAFQGTLTWLLIGVLLLFSAGDPDPIDPQRLV